MAEEQSPKVYLVSAEQLQTLKAARNPEVAQVVSAIETQTIGSIPQRLRDKAAESKGTISEKYKAAVAEATAKFEEAKASRSGSTE